MIFKTSAGFKAFAIISIALISVVLAGNRPVCAGAADYPLPHVQSRRPDAIIVGQSQTPATPPQTNSRTSESSESESGTPEEQNSQAAEREALRDFRPTEKIKADQAVDFPYDI